MFEDDIDIDEILNSSGSTNSLKRFNTDYHGETSLKRPKIKPSTLLEDVEETPKLNTAKKLFRFKKKVTVQNDISTDVVKLDVNDIIASPIIEISPQSCSSERKGIVPENTNCYRIAESETSTQTKSYQDVEAISRVTVDCDKNFRSDSGNFNPTPKNVDQHVEKHSVSHIQNDKSTLRRRFPGPAGLLPERSFSNSSFENLNDSSRIDTKDEICSQSSPVNLNKQCWEQMMIDFKTQGIFLPEKYNIQWIKSRTIAKKLINQKTPFLAAFVDSIRSHSIQNPIVNIVLKDKTGTIQGTILHNLYEEHTTNLTVGSVVVLKETGVLNMGPNDEPYLTITRNNLVSIYSNKKRMVDGSSQYSGETVKIIVQNLSADEILNRINKTKREHELANFEVKKQSISLMNKDVVGPRNLNDTFRKVVRNSTSSNVSETPNLSVLKIKSVPSSNSVISVEESVNKSRENKEVKADIDEIRNFFENHENLDEFFNDEAVFCSTQKGAFNDNKGEKCVESEMETCNDENQERSRIFRDIFEGVDANALFDEF